MSFRPIIPQCSPSNPIRRRLVKYNPDIIRGCLKEVVAISVPSCDALRSFTVKNTLLLYQVRGLGVQAQGGEAEGKWGEGRYMLLQWQGS